MSVRKVWRVVVLCVAAAGAIAAGRAQMAGSKPTHEALTFNGDGVQRFKDYIGRMAFIQFRQTCLLTTIFGCELLNSDLNSNSRWRTFNRSICFS